MPWGIAGPEFLSSVCGVTRGEKEVVGNFVGGPVISGYLAGGMNCSTASLLYMSCIAAFSTSTRSDYQRVFITFDKTNVVTLTFRVNQTPEDAQLAMECFDY